LGPAGERQLKRDTRFARLGRRTGSSGAAPERPTPCSAAGLPGPFDAPAVGAATMWTARSIR